VQHVVRDGKEFYRVTVDDKGSGSTELRVNRDGKLLGRDGTLEDLNRALARQLREGQRDERDPALMAHLEATIADKIAIANPKWR